MKTTKEIVELLKADLKIGNEDLALALKEKQYLTACQLQIENDIYLFLLDFINGKHD